MQYLFIIKLFTFVLLCINCQIFLQNQVKPTKRISQSRNLQYLIKEYLLDRRQIPLKKNENDEKYINYKQRYGIRYNPMTIKRNLNRNENENNKKIDLITKDNIVKSSVEMTTTTTMNNIIDIDDPPNVTSAVVMTKTNIMKPSRIKITLELLLARLKQLLKLGVASIKSKIPSTSSVVTIPNNSNLNPHPPPPLHHPPTTTKGEQRFLNLFNIVQFENSPCNTQHHFIKKPLNGICYHKYECENLGGLVGDHCANGFGVCCIFLVNCNGSSKQNITYFQNPGYPKPSTERLICVLTIELLSTDVKQIHIDFVEFELNPPTIGTCTNDQFIVTGQNINNIIPVLCGINTGQHMYIQVDNAPDQKLFISILTKSFDTRIFNIRISQLIDNLAPENCLQYHQDGTAGSGDLETFNYRDEAEFVDLIEPSYFNNLNYVICIKRASGHCNIIYTNEWDDEKYEFQLVNVDQDGISVLPSGQAGAEIYDCAHDFISINGIRLCGEKLNDASVTNDFTSNAPVRDISNGPILIPVRTNEAVVGRGFRLHYEQIECDE